jgi:hypothetical protein
MEPFFEFFRCSNDFMFQKVYFSRVMRVYVGLVIISCLFLTFMLREYNCVLTKVDCLSACIGPKSSWRSIVCFPPAFV